MPYKHFGARLAESPTRAVSRVGAERHPPEFAGLADAAMHSPFKRDEAGSIPASRTILLEGCLLRPRQLLAQHGARIGSPGFCARVV